MEIIKDFENDLLKRQEVSVSLEADSNPNFDEMKKQIAEEFKKSEDVIDVYNINGSFGSNEFKVDAYIYDSKEDLEKNLQKKKGKKSSEEKQEAKPDSSEKGSAPAESGAPVEDKAEQVEEKPKEKPIEAPAEEKPASSDVPAEAGKEEVKAVKEKEQGEGESKEN